MKGLICSLLLVFLLFFSETLISQDAVFVLDRVYGLDQTLCNGKLYSYSPPPGTKGDQYLNSPGYSVGSVTLKGKCYRDVLLNYDIFNQQLLLQFETEPGLWNNIEVSKAWLDGFSMGKMDFEYLDLENNPRFFQVVGKGKVRILYYWRKNLDVDGSIGSYYLTFTRNVRDSYVLTDGQLKPFSNNGSFIRIFNPGMRAGIKSYLRKNKVRVKKASDQEMAELITFIGKMR